MPITKLSKEQADQLQALGEDPELFGYDTDTDEAVELGSMGTGLAEGAKGAARGVASGIASIPEFVGRGADLLHASFGGPKMQFGDDPRSLFTVLSEAVKNKVSEMLPRDPRAGVGTDVMEGLGNVAGTIASGGGLAKGGGRLISGGMKELLPAAAGVSGTAQSATQIADRELNRQVNAGERPDPEQALGKMGASLPLNLIANTLLGSGRLAGKLVEPMEDAAGFGARRVADALAGGAGGAAGNVVEQGLVEGKVDTGELGKATGLGAAVSAIAGAPLDAAGTPSPKKKATRFLGESTTKPASATPKTEELPQTLTDLDKQSILLAQEKGIERVLPKIARTPFDDAVDSLLKEGVQLNETDLSTLFEASKDKTKLPSVVRTLAQQHTIREAQRPMDPSVLIDKQKEKLDRVGELTSKRDAFVKTLEKNKEILGRLDVTGEQKYNAKWALAEAEKNIGALDELIVKEQEASAPGLEGNGFVRQPAAAAQGAISNPMERMAPIEQEGVTPGMEVIPRPTLPKLSENITKSLQEYMEGENGGPFDEGKPKVYNSGVDITPLADWAKKVWKEKGFNPLQLIRSSGSKLAAKHPAGAYVVGKFNELTNKRNLYANEATAAIQEFKTALEDPDFSSWINDSLTNGRWDLSDPRAQKFPEDAANIEPFMKRFHAIQNEKGIGVSQFDAAGNRTVRPALDSPGYFPMAIGRQVYDAMEAGGDTWAKLKKDWVDNWLAYRGNRPNAEQEALNALHDIAKPLGQIMGAGQPTFSAVRVQQGVPLPPSWRSNNLFESLTRYAQKWATDVAWGEVVQHDPVARRALGIQEDPMGNRTWETDPKTFGETTPQQRALAVREGERTDASWVKDDVDPNTTPIDMIVGDQMIRSLINSYTQSSHTGTGKFAQKVVNPFNSFAGSLIMQTPAAARDVLSAVTMLNEYVPVKEWSEAIPAFVEAVTHPNDAIAKAREGGAVPQDPQQGLFQHEAAGIVGDAMYKTADALRTVTGKNYADQWAKGIVYNVVHDLVNSALDKGIEHSLVTEFGPVDKTLPTQEIARQTAANVVDRVQPRYDFNSLPDFMIPQNKQMMGMLLKLSAFPIARFNKWYEDAVIPAYKGHPQRLIKSLLISGAIGGTITQEVINFLTDKKPQELTWAEWLKLPADVRDKTALQTMFGYIQAQGSTGIAGDTAYAMSKALAGQGVQPPALSGQYPAAIVGVDWLAKSASFANAVKDGYVDLNDLGDLGVELGRTAQNFRLVENWLGTDKSKDSEGLREQKIFRNLYGRSPKTLEKAADPATIRAQFFPDPFSFSKRLKSADTKEELRKLLPEIRKRTVEGTSIPIQDALQSQIFYEEVARRRGRKTAEDVLEEDKRKQNLVDIKKQIVDSYKR